MKQMLNDYELYKRTMNLSLITQVQFKFLKTHSTFQNLAFILLAGFHWWWWLELKLFISCEQWWRNFSSKFFFILLQQFQVVNMCFMVLQAVTISLTMGFQHSKNFLLVWRTLYFLWFFCVWRQQYRL